MTLEVVRAVGLVTVQDLGEPGRMHAAVPTGGALVPELLIAANRTVRNPDNAAAVEVQGQLVVRATADIDVAAGAEWRHLAPGEQLTVESGAMRASYLAVRGGITSPRVALLCAQLGAPLRAGDSLAPGVLAAQGEQVSDTFSVPEVVALVAGPDLDAFDANVLDILTSATYRISPSSNRVGTRLEGPPLPRRADYRERSRPMVKGALEVPGDGLPIVLGPEHPTTGGYPIVAVVAAADLGRFFATRLGGHVRFKCVNRA